MSIVPVNEIIGNVAWSAYTPEVIAELAPSDAGQLANQLYAGMKQSGIRRGPSRPFGPDAQAVEDVLFALRARANRP